MSDDEILDRIAVLERQTALLAELLGRALASVGMVNAALGIILGSPSKQAEELMDQADKGIEAIYAQLAASWPEQTRPDEAE